MLEACWCSTMLKKCNKSLNKSYRPVSLLPILSKVFKRSLFKKISRFFYDIFSKYLYGFKKGFSTQQCLLALLEKWNRSTESVSKVFYCLNHDLLIPKLNPYCFSLPVLRLIQDYLLNRKQVTRINNSYSTWIEIVLGGTPRMISFCSTFSLQICSSL